MSDYNQDDQGQQNPEGREPHPQGTGQNPPPPPKPGQQEKLPDQGILDRQKQEQLRKECLQNEEKGLIHQLPGGESG